MHGLSNLALCQSIYSHDIILICETWCSQQISPTYLPNHQTYCANATRDHDVGRASGGLLSAIRNQFTSEMIEESSWWLFNKVKAVDTTLIIGSVYFKKSLDLYYLLDMLQDTLEHIKAQHQYEIFVLGGDMNAKVGQVDIWPEEIFEELALNNCMSTTDRTVCKRGGKLIVFMADNNFVLINGRTTSDSPAQPTFDERGKSIIDLVWVDASCLHHVLDLEVLMEPSLSDHRPVCLSLNVLSNSKFNSSSTPSGKPVTSIKWTNSCVNEFQQYLRSVETPSTNSLQTQQLYELLHNTMIEAADKAGILVSKAPSAQQSYRLNPWFDVNCKEAKRKLLKALRTYKACQFSTNSNTNVAICKKAYRDICANKKKNIYTKH